MRVIAGKARGMKLNTIEGLSTRPTIDRMKETLFNIIAFDLPDARVLDLFSGSGGIGIEALSRGAKEAVFVESNDACARVIKENLLHTKLDKQATLLQMDVEEALRKLGNEGTCFDVIFMDPPYAAGLAEVSLNGILEHVLLAAEGFVIVEHGAKTPLLPLEGLRIFRQKEYKTTTLTFLCLEDKK